MGFNSRNLAFSWVSCRGKRQGYAGAGQRGQASRIDWPKKGVVFGDNGVVFANKAGWRGTIQT
jgi:hypothetical protein